MTIFKKTVNKEDPDIEAITLLIKVLSEMKSPKVDITFQEKEKSEVSKRLEQRVEEQRAAIHLLKQEFRRAED